MKTKPRKFIERENYQTECHAVIVKCILIDRCLALTFNDRDTNATHPNYVDKSGEHASVWLSRTGLAEDA